MWGLNGQKQPQLSSFSTASQQYKIPALPLQFQYLPVQILSKQFTKLNSNHQYRIHYLGPRPLNTLLLHKRSFQKIEQSVEQNTQQKLKNVIKFNRYKINLKNIVNCNFMNQKMQSNSHYKSSLFYRAFEGMNPYLALDKEFIFNSAFQSGNLDCAIKIKSNQFDLFLRVDSNTRGHTSWYYFSVLNGKKKDKIILNICNLTKSSGLYQQGMRPFVFSKRNWIQNGVYWQQEGINQCKIQQARLRYDIIYESINIGTTYKLSFQYDFMFEDDEVYFAYCIPYTYSQLQYDIEQYEQSNFVKKDIIGRTLTGLNIPILHITNHQYAEFKKKNIVVTGRVHPGESNSSLVLNGFIKFLINSSKEAEDLRNRCNFFIIPMLNPDGVILGNTRVSAVGKDLNREFLSNKKDLYPQIHAIKFLTAKLQKSFGVTMYLDFHGHSRKKNTFLYGPNYPISHAQYYKCRAFPRIVQKINTGFRFYSCGFSISRQKQSTARAVMLNQMKIPYSYTVQSSIGLYYNPQIMKTVLFNAELWNEMGGNIGCGLSTFILSLIDLDLMIAQRKTQRAKFKQQKALQSKFSKFKQDEVQILPKPRKNPLLQIFQQIKIISSQVKQFDQQVQSDDHDERQDLQNFKLQQFNNLVINGRQRQKRTQKIVQENEQIFNIQAPIINQQDQQDILNLKLLQGNKKISSLGKNSKTSQNKRANFFNIDQILQRNQFMLKKQKNNQKLLEQQKNKKVQKIKIKQQIDNKNKKQAKNFILSNKQRYSVTSKFTYPLQDRCQIVTLPKSIQTMRREMKKGRMLIINIQESRSKLLSNKTIQHKRMQSRQQRVSFLYSDLMKLRQTSRSSTGKISTVNENMYSRKSQMNLIQPQTYMALNAYQLDNMAMTITTFRSYK